jgi:hypothetical protein
VQQTMTEEICSIETKGDLLLYSSLEESKLCVGGL